MSRVLFVSGSMRRGGAERVISVLANNLANKGWDVSIVTLLYDGCGYELDERVSLIDVSESAKNQVLDTPRLIKTVRRIIKKLQPDAVISFMITINVVTWFATRGLKVRFIPSERNDPRVGRGAILQILSRMVYANSSTTVFQTKRAQSFFSENTIKKSVIIPNPVNLVNVKERKKVPRIVSVGRLELQKNQKLLIDAFAEVHKEFPEYVLHIYGSGSLEDELREHINQLELQKYVELKGNVPDVQEQIADAELFVLSSDFEGTSNALLEAMALGLTCISTDCAGAADVIMNGESGVIVPVGDKDAMIAAIGHLIMSRGSAMSMGEKARESIAIRYNAETVTQQWIKVIEGEK